MEVHRLDGLMSSDPKRLKLSVPNFPTPPLSEAGNASPPFESSFADGIIPGYDGKSTGFTTPPRDLSNDSISASDSGGVSGLKHEMKGPEWSADILTQDDNVLSSKSIIPLGCSSRAEPKKCEELELIRSPKLPDEIDPVKGDLFCTLASNIGATPALDVSQQVESTGRYEKEKTSAVTPPIKADEERDIYPEFPDHIKEKLFDSQIEGIQFLWREIVKNGGGALLAHTMGMGKTLQVITLLQLISQTAKSPDINLASQVPENLRGILHVLIVAPPGLLQNWKQEFVKWVPPNRKEKLLQFFTPSESKDFDERTDMLRHWKKSGGVLMLGYQMLRDYALGPRAEALREEKKLKKSKKLRRGVKRNDEGGEETSQSLKSEAITLAEVEKLKEAEELADIVLLTPSIVIADEAHVVKNEESMLSASLNQISTASRIALTGSPLANNLKEYYALANWVSKGLLKSKQFFSSFFINPIEAGLYEDSDRGAKLKSIRRLAILRYSMASKMHRCGITRIKHRLPEKTEFLITIELTDIQHRIYSLFTKNVIKENEAPTKKPSNQLEIKGFFDHIKCLRVLLNHPKILHDVFKERAQQNAKKEGVENFSLSETLSRSEILDIEDEYLLDNAHLKTLMKIHSFVRQYEDFDDPVYSNRITCLMTLLKVAEIINEKVLVFSISIPTLNYIEAHLKAKNIRACRLDGNTNSQSRQELTRKFNSDEGGNILLISTKAGGVGLNITSATRVVIFDFDFSPQDEEQAIARAYRLGQTKPVFVYRFKVGGTFEDVIYNKSIFKISLAARVVDSRNPVMLAKKGRKKAYFEPPNECGQRNVAEFRDRYNDLMLHSLIDSGLVRGIDLQDTFANDETEDFTGKQKEMFQVDLAIMNGEKGMKDSDRYDELSDCELDLEDGSKEDGNIQIV